MQKIGVAESRKRRKKIAAYKKSSTGRTGKKMKSSVTNALLVLIIIVALAVMVYTGHMLYGILMEYKAGKDEYNSIADTVIHEREADEEDIRELADVQGTVTKYWTPPFEVDFDELAVINSDVVGWLYMEALPDISYPVVQGEDNEYYLHHTYKKESVFAGSIFADMKNSDDFTDQNTILYGHNMKDGSMFGTLRKYKQQATIAESPYFWILTPDVAYKYQIFSVHSADVGGSTYTLIKGPGKETIEYGETMAAESEMDLESHSFTATDKIVTLSTCTGDSSVRFVVQGVRIEPE